MADLPCAELGNFTPLECAHKPNMDSLAAAGRMGMVRTVTGGLPPGSDVANLSVLGYDPSKFYTGRAPLEAVSMGVELNENDVAFRCNLVTLSEADKYEKSVMVDYSAGEIMSDAAAILIKDFEKFLASDDMKFYPGISYRHLMVWRNGPADTLLTPPHDISGRGISEYLPAGNGGEALLSVMKRSNLFFRTHHYNMSGKGVRPVSSVWFWGQGKSPSLPAFRDKFGLAGAVISAVDLLKGIGISAGMEVIEVDGATGNIHTNFSGKARAAAEAFRNGADLVYLHIEAPDEAGHQGNAGMKVKAIEEIDSKVLGPLLKWMEEFGHFRVMVLPDHPTPLSLKTHTSDPVPFVVYDSGNSTGGSEKRYCEKDAAGGFQIQQGHDLMDYFINGSF